MFKNDEPAVTPKVPEGHVVDADTLAILQGPPTTPAIPEGDADA